jgi:protein-tyrosine-phosphatase
VKKPGIEIKPDIGSVLFVCYGNICRSPMAEFLFRQMLQDADIDSIQVMSAGLHAFPGNGSPREAVEVMAEIGIDMSRHRARALTLDMGARFQLVLLMDRYNLREYLALFPRPRNKAGLLRSFSTGSWGREIDDPYGERVESYRRCRDIIAESLDGLLSRLLESRSITP